MYTKTARRSGSSSRFSTRHKPGIRSYTGSGRFSARPGVSRGRSGSSSRRKQQRGSVIDERLFINKAKEIVVETYMPKHTFNDFGLHATIVLNLQAKKYVTPSPIQDQAIPMVLAGKDVIGIANTGTGKTAAFLLPLIHKLAEDRSRHVLVLAPTRELAQQIEVEFRAFTRGMRLFSVACVGGAPIGRQMRELERGVQVVIGTPGRVKDLIARKKINMGTFKAIVLDEADRMLDMGFIGDIRSILSSAHPDRQSLFFSATLPPAIQALCSEFLNNPETVSVKTRDTAESIDQDIVRVVDQSKKIDLLHGLLAKPEYGKVLIFRERKHHTEELGRELRNRGIKVLALHGDMRNREREYAVRALASGMVQAVIATDVAARGIDIPDVTHVINYDVPQNYETYIHRIGRTGRGGAKGAAITFV